MHRIGITGHANIPAAAVEQIRGQVVAALAGVDGALVGVTNLARGADQLFAHCVLQRGGSLHVIVPCQRYLDTFPDSVAQEEFHALMRRATRIENMPYRQCSQEAFLDAGMAVVDACDLLIAVWDGQQARGPGGTADVVDYARRRGTPVSIIWPEGFVR